jgi:hypothetical protein
MAGLVSKAGILASAWGHFHTILLSDLAEPLKARLSLAFTDALAATATVRELLELP